MNGEDIAIELFSLLDNIDTLTDICKDDDKLFRRLAMREAGKRFDFANTDGYKVNLKTAPAPTLPVITSTYKPEYIYTYIDKNGQRCIIKAE